MTSKHYLLLAGCLVSLGALVSGFHDWSEALRPATIGGVLGIIGTQVMALYTEKP
jgi:hypothetical protein